MKTTIKILLGLLVSVNVLSQSINFEEAASPNEKLEIKLNQLKGLIEIKGWNKEAIQIKGKVNSGNDNPISLTRTNSGFKLQFKHSDDSSKGKKIATDLIIYVPNRFDINFNTQTGLRMRDITGEFQIVIANDDTELSNLKGKADISVVRGKLNISDSYLKGTTRNTNGDIKMMNTDFIGIVRATNASIRLSRAPEGIAINCTNGSIKIQSANGFIDAKTTNASLTIGELNGRLKFNSTNGSVEATLIGDSNEGSHDIEIETMRGSADLVLPKNYSMDFDLKVSNSDANSRKRFIIETDFEAIKIEKRDNDKGKYDIYGRGKIGSAKNKTTIHVNSGNVRILESNK